MKHWKRAVFNVSLKTANDFVGVDMKQLEATSLMN